MNKFFKIMAGLMASLFILTTIAPLTVHAESPLYITENAVTIKQGENHTIGLEAVNYVSYYIVGSTSSSTYVTVPSTQNGGELTVYVGKDEQANTFHVYIYLDGWGGTYVDLEVNVMKVYSPIAAVDATAPTTIAVPYADGTNGTPSLTTENKIGMFYTAAGTAMASFSVKNDSGKLMQLTLGNVVTNGANYITVKTPTAGTINISASDKAVLQAQGIAGLYLNGKYVNWP